MSNVQIPNLPAAAALSGAEQLEAVQAGTSVQITTAQIAALAVTAGTVTQVNAGTGLTGGPITTTGTISLANTGVAAATYGSVSAIPVLTVNAQGQITSATTAAAGSGTVTNVELSTSLSGITVGGSPITTTGTLTLSGTLDVLSGGTGATTLLANGLLLGSGTSAVGVVAAGTSGYALVSNGGASAPTYQQVSLTSGVSGTLPVANGGTGVTTSTGTVNVVLSTSPTLVTPVLGVASATTINKVALTAPATGSTLTIADGKTLTASNTVIFTATDGSTLAIGAGGTLASAAYVATGTSGGTIPLLNGTNSWSGQQTINVAGTQIALGSTGVNSGQMTLAGSTSGTVTLKSAAAAGTWSMTLPTSAGTSTYVLQTDGTGVTSWAAPGGGGGGSGTVTSVDMSVPSFLSISGNPITTAGTLAVGLSGTALPTPNGGTGLTDFTASNQAIYSTSSSALTAGTLPVAAGGTGAITLTGYVKGSGTSAFTASASVPASDLSGTLAIANGGTNATTASGALANLTTYTTNATAGGTTVLTNTSPYYQYFTGSTTQTIQMPVVTTLSLGWSFHIVNNSSGNLSLVSSGSNSIGTVLPGTTVHITCILTTGTTAASWDYGYTDFGTATGTGSVVLSAAPTLTGTLSTANHTITSASANALAVGLAGTTNPALNVDASTATSATGLNIKSAAAAGGLALSVISSGAAENLTINAKGTGTIGIGTVSTGAITLTRATTMSAALTYGGVTLTNAVTGTGSMVLSAAPTLTGTLSTANHTITSASANALAVGLAGTTNPAFNVDASTAISVTGLNIKSAAAAGGLALSVISSGTNENLTINAKATGTIGIGTVSTGAVTITPALTLGTALTQGNGGTGITTATNGITVSAIEFIIDGGGSVITTGTKGYLEVPFACTVNQWTVLADQSGSITLDVYSDTYANYGTNTSMVGAGTKPTISAATKGQSAPTSWTTTSIAAGNIIGFNVATVATVTRVTVSLKVTRT